MDNKLVSVIVPTYNRDDSLRRLLASLQRQTMAPAEFEVIVADDGAGDGARLAEEGGYPFVTIGVAAGGQGATLARNLGSQQSRGDVLVFVDDDISLEPAALAALYEACQRLTPPVIVLGCLSLPEGVIDSNRTYGPPRFLNGHGPERDYRALHYSACKTGLLALRRRDFEALGGFQDPTGGWPNWDDVDFGYRASRAGFRLYLALAAQGMHHDTTMGDLRHTSRRWHAASKAAVRLFRRYPEIAPEMPMFEDKLPIAWKQDGLRLVARKLARRLASTGPSLWFLERAATRLPDARLRIVVQRWLLGGHMARGYRAGLRELGPAMEKKRADE
jgi:glycosyltransferase involved in cell wall biosynthesis